MNSKNREFKRKFMKIKSLYIAVLCFLLASLTAFAQQKITVSGRVVDKDGMPVISAGVFVKGTTQGTVTDFDGNYVLAQVPVDAVLTATNLGYAESERPVDGKTVVDFVLQDESVVLDDVIVVAYGTAKKESFTGSASVVKGDELSKRPVGNLTKSFEGTVAGVQVTSGGGQPGEGASIMVRGVGSVNASSTPLYVVDGVPYDGAISSINPADIETMTVLKDASAGALYGARGANGVIVITTKKGSADRININYKGNFGLTSRALPRYDLVNMSEYVELTYEALRNSAQYAKNGGMDFEGASAYAAAHLGEAIGGLKNPEYYNPYKNYTWETLIDQTTGKVKSDAKAAWDENWMDEISNNKAFRTEHIVSVSGGTEKTSYLYSMGYYKENGTLQNTDFDRFTGRISGDVQATDWLKIGMNANLAHSVSNFQDASGSEISNVWYTAQFMAPVYPVYLKDINGNDVLDENGNRQYEYGSVDDNGYANRVTAQGFNSKAELYNNKAYYKRNSVSARSFVRFGTTRKDALLYGLNFTVNLGVDFTDYGRTGVADKYHGNAADQGGSVSKLNTRTLSYTLNELLTWQRKFGDHSIDILAGHEYYRYNYNYAAAAKNGIVAGIDELGSAVTTTTNTSYSNDYAIESVLARVNYGYADKYYFDASWRTDGSSRFYKDNRWGNFWSVGASWRITNEEFMAGTSSWLNNLTAKISYGVQGNDNLGSYYAWQGRFNYGWPNGSRPGTIASSIENKLVTWEKNGNLNTGIEASLFGGRLSATVEYYSRRTKDMLLNNPLAISSGFTGYDDNVGSMVNRGFEASFRGVVFERENFHWDATAMVSLNRNKVTELTSSQNVINYGSMVIEVGKPIYTFYMPKSAGVSPATGKQLYWANYRYAVDPASGSVTTEKCDEYVTDNVGLASLSKYYYGSRQALFSGSFSSNFVIFKNFDFSFLTTYSVGGKILDSLYDGAMNVTYAGNNWHKNQLRRWQKKGDITDVPMAEIGGSHATVGESLIDASYFAIKNITLGYTIPTKVTSRVKMKSFRVFFTADNIALFSHLDGMDPQYNFAGTVSYTYSPSRVFALGLDINF